MAVVFRVNQVPQRLMRSDRMYCPFSPFSQTGMDDAMMADSTPGKRQQQFSGAVGYKFTLPDLSLLARLLRRNYESDRENRSCHGRQPRDRSRDRPPTWAAGLPYLYRGT